MTKPQRATRLTAKAQIIHDSIDSLRAELRLFPDLYAERIAQALDRHERATSKGRGREARRIASLSVAPPRHNRLRGVAGGRRGRLVRLQK